MHRKKRLRFGPTRKGNSSVFTLTVSLSLIAVFIYSAQMINNYCSSAVGSGVQLKTKLNFDTVL